ncbi:MAG: ion channel [Roseburia sp.]|nr:ion channel [Roseburia sp.]MCM1097440.1 ion channel [Ruminococcus flavefaciens]
MKKRRWIMILAALAGYAALLRLLVYVESFSQEATISTVGEAAWFSLVTLTTAGYGDYYPVTPWGRIIGTVFLLLSTGLLALLVGAAVSLMTGLLLPWLRLRGKRRKAWYLFSDKTPEALILSDALRAEEPGVITVFCGVSEAAAPELRERRDCFGIKGGFEEALRLRKNSAGCTLIVMGPDSLFNYTRALAAAASGLRVCCQTELTPEEIPDNITLFDRRECCARRYWQYHPLKKGERTILLIGGGCYGEALLEQALTTNVQGGGRATVYHVFGGDGAFLRHHPYLGEVMEMRWAEEPDREPLSSDAVLLHKESWDADAALLAGADRIILCGDDDGENLEIYRLLCRCFAPVGEIHLRLSHPLAGAVVFGTDEETLTGDLALRIRQDEAARAMHEIYRRSTGGKAPRWEELGDFARCSNRSAADHLLTKVRILLEDEGITALTAENCREAYRRYQETREEKASFYRELEHCRWMRFYALHGWRYAPVRDNARRLHPDLRPFDRLTEEEQAKDDYAWELLGEVCME